MAVPSNEATSSTGVSMHHHDSQYALSFKPMLLVRLGKQHTQGERGFRVGKEPLVSMLFVKREATHSCAEVGSMARVLAQKSQQLSGLFADDDGEHHQADYRAAGHDERRASNGKHPRRRARVVSASVVVCVQSRGTVM